MVDKTPDLEVLPVTDPSTVQSVFELQEIVDELEKRHSKKYTIEQLRAWGHMMMKKHDSYDDPPDKPFFKQSKEEQPAATGTRSPGKRIHYQSECMDQLDKWHSLLRRGVITQEQYTELQESILSDIKKLNDTISLILVMQ